MSMVTTMDGVGDVNRVDTVHDNVSEEHKQAIEKAMENKEEVTQVQEPVAEFRPLTEEEQAKQMPPITLNQKGPIDIWLQFDTISVGSGEKTATFDLAKLLAGIEKLADVTMIREDSNDEDSTKGE